MPETGKTGVAARCDRCKNDVYAGELVHLIDGYVVCPECFLDFAFDYFEDRLIPAEEAARARRINEGEDIIEA